MKIRSIVTILTAFLVSQSALAATNTSDVAVFEKSLQKLSYQTASMQKEIRMLKAQIRALKRNRRQTTVRSESTPVPIAGSRTRKIHYEKSMQEAKKLGVTSFYTQGPTVTTSPYLGIRSAFDGSDLVVNLSTLNEDLRLLKERRKIENALGLEHMDSDHPMRPLVELSGKVETEALFTKPFAGSSMSDINVSGLELDTMVEVGHWATAFISLAYDDSSPVTGARVTNSNIFLDRGFLILGNLNQSPYYVTIGQMFVPFGSYSSQMVTTTMTQSLGRTKERALLLGYSNKGLYGSVYAFKGDAFVRNAGIINNGGVNVGYDWGTAAKGGSLGVGVLANIADSEGMQATGAAAGFLGFSSAKPASESLAHGVPALDVNFHATAWQYGLIIEYIRALRSFAAADLTFNGVGATPQALNVELGYRFKNLDVPLGVAIGYEYTNQALGLNLPRHSILVAATTSWWKNTLQAIEYRHDINYSASDMAVGKGVASTGGGVRNMVTAKVGVYF